MTSENLPKRKNIASVFVAILLEAAGRLLQSLPTEFPFT
jgi:hypothetical protein